jgi:hypothetical protein
MLMGCIYHPNSEAYCSVCQAELCRTCALRLENGRSICHRCVVALSVHDVRVEAARRKLAEEAERLGLERKWRPTYSQILLSAAAVLIFLLFGLQLYWNRPVPRRQAILDPSSPIGLLTTLRFSLEHSAAVNNGRYPKSLYDLLPQFLTDTPENRRILRQFDYRLDERQGYLLQIKESAPFSGKELVATAAGIRLRSEELTGEGVGR